MPPTPSTLYTKLTRQVVGIAFKNLICIMVQLTTAITIIYSPVFVFKNYGKNVDEIPHYCVNILNFFKKKKGKKVVVVR